MKAYLLWVTVVLAVLAQIGDAQEANWVDLIGGADLNAWRRPSGKWETVGLVTSPPRSPRRLVAVPGTGTIYNGVEGRTRDLLSKREFGDVEVHVEFMVPRQSNSGIYRMGRSEVQVLDSFGQPPRDNEAGGIYKIAVPEVNAALPPGEWQTYDITFHAPRFDSDGKMTEPGRITVVYNGVTIHDNVKLAQTTGGAIDNKTGEPGPLLLQDHGNLVQYRNIWAVPLGN